MSLRSTRSGESGQAAILLLGVIGALIAGALILASFGQALGAKGKHQRAADLAAVSAARTMRELYPRLFEPAYIGRRRNRRHLSVGEFRARARAGAVAAGRANGVPVAPRDVRFPGGGSFAPTRVEVRVRGEAEVRVAGEGDEADVPVAASATAELAPTGGGPGMPGVASGGGYEGPLAYRGGEGMRPDVARAYDRLAAAAKEEAGLTLLVTSGFRSDAEQARLFAAHPDPRWVAPPGRSLHRLATELDLGPPAAYGWLARNAERFKFRRRYSWEPWHFGYTLNPASVSAGSGGGPGDGRTAVPSFVPERYEKPIARSAQRWNVSAALLAAQIYAESGFNPFAVSPAGAGGIAQFIPSTAEAYGLRDRFDPVASIDAQAHLMRDLLRRFAAVPLALAAYNAGPARVEACGCVPPIPETRAYVARILGLLGGAGAAGMAGAGGLEVRLVE